MWNFLKTIITSKGFQTILIVLTILFGSIILILGVWSSGENKTFEMIIPGIAVVTLGITWALRL